MRALPALLLTFLVSAAGGPPARAEAPLAAAQVRDFMATIERAARARDLPSLVAAMAAECRIELRVLIDGHEQITLLTRAEYVEMLTSGFAALRDLDAYDYMVTAQHLDMERDPPAATVVSEITETSVLRGRRSVVASEETARVERRDGELKLVAVSTLTRAAP